MKILLINKFYYLKGGSERYFFNLKNLLESQGHQVISFSMNDEKNLKTDYSQYFIDNIDFNKKENIFRQIKKAFHLIYSFEARKKLKKLIEKEKPDIAHMHNIAHQISPSILSLLKKHKIPIVQTLHDFKLICPNYQLFTQGKVCERCKKRRYYQAVFHRCMKNSFAASLLVCLEMFLHHSMFRFYKKYVDTFIAPSEFLKNKLIEWGWDEKKIVYLPNFVNLEELESSQKVGQPQGSDYFIYFGRLAKEKGIEVLTDSMQYVKKDVRLKIVGQGQWAMSHEQWAKSKSIELAGYKEGKGLRDLIRNAMFVVAPSIIYENCPMSILESFALSKPVIGSRLGGISELVEDGKTGLLFEPGNTKELAEKINYLLDHTDEVKKMGLTAKENVVRYFNPSDHYKKVVEVYNSLIR